MTYGLHNPKVILLWKFWLMDYTIRKSLKMTYGLYNLKVMFKLSITKSFESECYFCFANLCEFMKIIIKWKFMFYEWRCKYGRINEFCASTWLFEGDYGIHFTTDEVNKISFHSCLLHYNLKKWFCNIVIITLCRCFLREKTYLNGSVGLVMDLVLLLSLLGLT